MEPSGAARAQRPGNVRLVDLPQPDVRFTRALDGVAIAYWEIGSGQPLVLAQPQNLSHAELEWAVPRMEALYVELAQHFRLVRFDPRGAGMSDEPPAEISIAGFCRDVDAVVDALDLDEFHLAGVISMGPVAVQYAVDHPDRVTSLVLCDTGPDLADLSGLEQFSSATIAVIELGVLPSFSEIFPAGDTDGMHALENLMKGSRLSRPSATVPWQPFDVTRVMGGVLAPTLVIRSRDSAFSDQEQTRRLVTGIAGAQMRIVPGTLAPFVADLDTTVEAFVSFLLSDHHVPSGDSDDEFRTIVFTDLVSSTEVLSRLGDDKGRMAFRDVEHTVAQLCERHHGWLVKHLGDGSLISFRSTQRALAFGFELQQRMATSPLDMRIGMAAGEPILENDDIHGAVVVQASRVADLGERGEIVVSDAVRQLAIGKGFSFTPVGDVPLKGFDQATSVWTVRGKSES